MRALQSALLALVVLVLPAPTESHASSARLDHVERQIIANLNAIRAQNGLPRLARNRALSRSADAHCSDMLRRDFFAHASSNGQSMVDRVESYRPSNRVGETLAYLPREQAAGAAQRIVDMWMNSPPHRASLLSPEFRRIGLARKRGAFGNNRVVVYTADLASRH